MLETPLSVLYQLIHCSLIEKGCATEWENITPDEEATLRATVERIKRRRAEKEGR